MVDEELIKYLRDSEPVMVRELVKETNNAICAGKTKEIRGKPAFYAFWWTNNPVFLINTLASTSVIHNHNTLNRENTFLNPDFKIPPPGKPIPLFIGATRALAHRVSLHLKLAVDGRLWDKLQNRKDKIPEHSYHQLRLGLEELFPGEKDIKELIFKNVGLTFNLADDESEVLNNMAFIYKLRDELKPIINISPDKPGIQTK